MTPPISKELMASRPLYNPDPDTFVAQDAVKDRTLRYVRLSDFAVLAFNMNIWSGQVNKAAVDMFENVYVRGAKPRLSRVHEGRPALAPDGTVMSIGGIAYPGSSGQRVGQWHPDNVKGCPGYQQWITQLTQTEAQIVARGYDADEKNKPLPDANDLATASSLVPTQAIRPSESKALKNPKGEDKGKSRSHSFMDNINELVDATADHLTHFIRYTQTQEVDTKTREALTGIIHGKIDTVLSKDSSSSNAISKDTYLDRYIEGFLAKDGETYVKDSKSSKTRKAPGEDEAEAETPTKKAKAPVKKRPTRKGLAERGLAKTSPARKRDLRKR